MEKEMTGEESLKIITLITHFTGPSIAPLAVPAAMLTGYLVPGYMLKRKVGHEKI